MSRVAVSVVRSTLAPGTPPGPPPRVPLPAARGPAEGHPSKAKELANARKRASRKRRQARERA